MQNVHIVFCFVFQEDIPRQLVYISLYLVHIAGAYILKFAKLISAIIVTQNITGESLFFP